MDRQGDRTMERTKAVILAAGKGSRLQCEKDEIPKALRQVGGKALIEHVLAGIDFVAPEDITIVIGVMGDKIREYLGDKYNYVWQKEQHGTAHAMLCAEEAVGNFDGPVLCLYCDMPLLSISSFSISPGWMGEDGIRLLAIISLLIPSSAKFL